LVARIWKITRARTNWRCNTPEQKKEGDNRRRTGMLCFKGGRCRLKRVKRRQFQLERKNDSTSAFQAKLRGFSSLHKFKKGDHEGTKDDGWGEGFILR